MQKLETQAVTTYKKFKLLASQRRSGSRSTTVHKDQFNLLNLLPHTLNALQFLQQMKQRSYRQQPPVLHTLQSSFIFYIESGETYSVVMYLKTAS